MCQKRVNQTKNPGIYIHIPFCVKKCLYCDFLSFPVQRLSEYLEALYREMHALRYTERVDTVYIGGGTPTILSGEQIKRIMEQVYSCFRVDENAEITMEGNPGTITRENVKGYCEAGVNRFSIGLQSSHERELQALGRIHTYEQFLESMDYVRSAGIDNINVDVMSAVPFQTLKSYEETLQKVTALAPRHISAYSLIVEEGTAFFHMEQEGKLSVAGEEEERKMYEMTKQILQGCGYQRYEISNYSIPGYESRHNIKYWTGNEYAGLGLGASSLLGHTRYRNTEDFSNYLAYAGKKDIRIEKALLSKKEQMEEFMFLGLRMAGGVAAEEFLERFGESLENIYGPVIKKAERENLVKYDGKTLALTEFGTDVANRVMAEFLLDI